MDVNQLKDYILGLKDLGYQALSGEIQGLALVHREDNWSLEDRATAQEAASTVRNGLGWSLNFSAALDALSERQFGSTKASVRENLQNSRDSNPKTGIYIGEIEDQNTQDRNRTYFVSDDGDGMDVSGLGDYLFSIFGSSKRGDQTTAGEHGIGFISNLGHSQAIVVDTKKDDSKALTLVIKGKYGAEGNLRQDRYSIEVFPGKREESGTAVISLNFKPGEHLYGRIEDVARESCKYLDKPLYAINSNGESEQINMSLEDIELDERRNVKTDTIRRGVIGLSNKRDNGIVILQNGIKVSDIRLEGIQGVIDAIVLKPLIGRTGFLQDEAYSQFMGDLWSQVTDYANSIASKGSLDERERNFLHSYLKLLAEDGYEDIYVIPKKIREKTTLTDVLLDAKVFPTVFNADIQRLDQRIGSLTEEEKKQYKELLEKPAESKILQVSLREIRETLSSKGAIYYASGLSQRAEDFRKSANIVLYNDNLSGLGYGLGNNVKTAKRLSGSEIWSDFKDIETITDEGIVLGQYGLDTISKRFLKYLSKMSGCEVRLAHFQTPEGINIDSELACNKTIEYMNPDRDWEVQKRETITYVNMNTKPNQQLLAAYSLFPDNPFVALAVKAIIMPTISHEETHSFGFKGHGEHFRSTNDSLMQYHEKSLAEQLLEVCEQESGGTIGSQEGTLTRLEQLLFGVEGLRRDFETQQQIYEARLQEQTLEIERLRKLVDKE